MIYTFWQYAITNVLFLCAERIKWINVVNLLRLSMQGQTVKFET